MKSIELLLPVCAVAVGLMSSPLTAGVVLISSEAALRVTGIAGPETFDRSATNAGFSADAVTGDASGPSGATVRASALHGIDSLHSTAGGVSGSAGGGGNVSAMYPLDNPVDFVIVSATSNYALRFRIIDNAEPFAVTGVFGGDLTSAAVRLTEASDPILPQVIFATQNDGPFSFHFDQRGVLAPGSYTLAASAFAGSSGGGGSETQFSSFETTFAFGHSTQAVPLPAAVWTGGSGLLVAAGVTAVRRRRSPQAIC